jgi:hypothetical protein
MPKSGNLVGNHQYRVKAALLFNEQCVECNLGLNSDNFIP